MSEGRYTLTPSAAVFDDRLTHIQYRVLAALGSYTGKDRTAWPRQGEIAKRMGIDRKSVNRACKKLHDLGYVVMRPQYREDGSRGANHYFVLLDGGVPPEVQGGDRSGTGGVPTEVHHEVDHNNKPAPKRATRARARGDFTLGEKELAYAESKGLTEQGAKNEFEKFANYHDARGSTFKDWSAAWRNWVIKSMEFKTPRNQPRSDRSRTGRSFAAVKEKIALTRGMAETAAAHPSEPEADPQLDFDAPTIEGTT